MIGKLVLNLAIMSSQYWAPHSKLAPFLQALQDQVDEFVKGFTRELDFEQEARNHRLFYERSMSSSMWHVPALYASSHRILEMEYLDDADSLVTALKTMPTYKRRRFQRKLSEHFLYTVLSHLLFYQEAHGDLHPGNIMINARGELHLIDWGNAVDMNGKWAAVWNYLVGAALGDRVLLTNALINMSRDPEADAKRWDEIHDLLGETLDRKNIQPLSATNFLWVLSKEGMEGLQTVLHLVANSQQLGIIVRSDYMHLSRSLFAAAGSFATLYEDSSKMLLFRDMAISLARMPWLFTKDKTKVRLAEIRDNWKRRIPVRVSLQTRVPDYRNYPQKLAEPGNKALDNALEKKIA